jgi:hypothetical protein
LGFVEMIGLGVSMSAMESFRVWIMGAAWSTSLGSVTGLERCSVLMPRAALGLMVFAGGSVLTLLGAVAFLVTDAGRLLLVTVVGFPGTGVSGSTNKGSWLVKLDCTDIFGGFRARTGGASS